MGIGPGPEVSSLRSSTSGYRFGDACAVWPTADGGHVAIDVTAPAARRTFLSEVAKTEAGANDDRLGQSLGEFVANHSAEDAARILSEVGIPASAVLDTRRATGIADFWVRGMFLHAEHGRFGTIIITGSPVRLDGKPLRLDRLGPRPEPQQHRQGGKNRNNYQ